MPGFMPGIHAFPAVLHVRRKEGVDGRDKPGHDGEGELASSAGPVVGAPL
jgi:hypothetical protein